MIDCDATLTETCAAYKALEQHVDFCTDFAAFLKAFEPLLKAEGSDTDSL